MPSGVKDIQLTELKDIILQLNKTVSEQNALIASLQKSLDERTAEDAKKDRMMISNYYMNKVYQIARETGRRPVLAFGNSGGKHA